MRGLVALGITLGMFLSCGSTNTNVVANPYFRPPLYVSAPEAPMFPGGFPIAFGPTPPMSVPHGWKIQQSEQGMLTSLTSAASGVTMTWTQVDPAPPVLVHGDGLVSDPFDVTSDRYIVSFDGTESDNWYVSIIEDTGTAIWATNPPVVHAGGGHMRAEWRPRTDTQRAVVGVFVASPGVYSLSRVAVVAR